MSRNAVTSKVVDEVIRFGALGGMIGSVIIAPGMARALDKPLQKLWRNLDARERERRLRKVIYKMKENGYLAGQYEHGLRITQKAKDRLAKVELDKLAAKPQARWDKKWRIIIYDIPEEHKQARNALAARLRMYGCSQLQKSTWITPFPCRNDIEAITSQYGINQFISYFEAINLENAAPLLRRFRKKYPNTSF